MRRMYDKEYLSYKDTSFHVDNLLIVSKSPQHVADALIFKQNVVLEGIGPATNHLGFDFNLNGEI